MPARHLRERDRVIDFDDDGEATVLAIVGGSATIVVTLDNGHVRTVPLDSDVMACAPREPVDGYGLWRPACGCLLWRGVRWRVVVEVVGCREHAKEEGAA